jgi:hypothetical protein
LINDDLPFRSTDGSIFAQYPAGNIPSLGFARHYFTDLAGSPTSVNNLAAATNKGLFLSTNNGVNWFVSTATGLTTTNLSAVGYSSTGTLFAGTHDGQIFCSTNGGLASFVAKTTPAGWASSVITDIVTNGTTMYFLTDGNGAWQETSPTCP